MRIENRATNTRDINKIQLSPQKTVNGNFVRSIQNRSASAAVTGDLKTKIKSRKEFSIRRMKVE